MELVENLDLKNRNQWMVRRKLQHVQDRRQLVRSSAVGNKENDEGKTSSPSVTQLPNRIQADQFQGKARMDWIAVASDSSRLETRDKSNAFLSEKRTASDDD